MSDFRINGNNQAPYTSTVGVQSVPSQVNTTSGVDATTPEDENNPLIGADNSESLPPEGEVPDPTAPAGAPDPYGDPMARAAWLEQELKKQEQYVTLADELQYIIESGGPEAAEAQKLLTKLRQVMWSDSEIEERSEELDGLVDFLPKSDLDGDGVANGRVVNGVLTEVDPDIDGDGLTNAAEIANNTDPHNLDSDYDGITDYGELWLKQHNYEYGWMDANNADANSNGIVDGNELPASVKVDNNGKPIVVGGKPEDGTSTSSEGGAGSASSKQWNPPSSEAQTVNAADGDQTVSADYDVVVNANGGNLDFSKDGSDLVIKTSTGTIRVTGYYGEDGTPKGKVYVEGSADSVSTSNGSNMFGVVDSNGDGYVDAGIRFASGVNTDGITNNYDPFNGEGPAVNTAESTAEVTVYDNGTGAFQVPTEIDGQEVKAVEVKLEGDDVLVICKGSINGEPLKTFKIVGGKVNVENGSIHFKLADNGQYFYSAAVKATVNGGKGDDEITVKGGTANGNEGNDMIRSIDEDATLNGGRGDDFVLGGSGTDTIIGGDEDDGMDFLHSGSSSGDTLRSGDGDDIIIVDNTKTDASYNLDAGAGSDMTNWANIEASDPSHGVEVGVANPSQIMTYLEEHKTDANSNLLDELEKLHNSEGNGILDGAASMASEMIKQAAAAYLVEKKKQYDAKYGKESSGDGFNGGVSQSQGSGTPEETGDTTSQSVSSPGLMFQSIEVEEERRRRRREEQEGLPEDGEIPAPIMFD